MRLLSAPERLAEKRGLTVVVGGESGSGKTTLIKWLPKPILKRGLYVSSDNGDLALGDAPITRARLETHADFLDLAARIGGPDPSLPASEPFSQAHFDACADLNLDAYDPIIVDDIREPSRKCFAWSGAQPEARTARDQHDLRGQYLLHGRSFVRIFRQVQRARKTIIVTALLERHVDDLNVASRRLQFEGQMVGRELPGIVDILATLTVSDKGKRALVCTSPNPWGLPAKDRSGRLDQIEPADLGALLAKVAPLRASAANGQNTEGENDAD